jgi:hypothetical protein
MAGLGETTPLLAPEQQTTPSPSPGASPPGASYRQSLRDVKTHGKSMIAATVGQHPQAAGLFIIFLIVVVIVLIIVIIVRSKSQSYITSYDSGMKRLTNNDTGSRNPQWQLGQMDAGSALDRPDTIHQKALYNKTAREILYSSDPVEAKISELEQQEVDDALQIQNIISGSV